MFFENPFKKAIELVRAKGSGMAEKKAEPEVLKKWEDHLSLSLPKHLYDRKYGMHVAAMRSWSTYTYESVKKVVKVTQTEGHRPSV
jgi:hypothetical protein